MDDTLDVFAVHGVGGTVGMILTSMFSTVSVNAAGVDGAFYGNGMELGKTLLVLVIIVPWFFASTWAILWFTDKLITLRVSGKTVVLFGQWHNIMTYKIYYDSSGTCHPVAY